MNTEVLRSIGLTENEIKIYIDLLKSGSSTSYDISKRTGIYRVHIYDKLEQLMSKGLASHVYEGSKKIFRATAPSKIKQYLEDRKKVLITGIDDRKYQDALSLFMKQYFRDLKNQNIKERIITIKKKGVFLFDKSIAPTTTYRFLDVKQFNPTNTVIYGNNVVIVTWGSPVTAVMIKNKEIAETYRNHFEHLWKIAN